MADKNSSAESSAPGNTVHHLTHTEGDVKEGAPSKRRRVAVACTSCRTRKSRVRYSRHGCRKSTEKFIVQWESTFLQLVLGDGRDLRLRASRNNISTRVSQVPHRAIGPF